MAATVTGTALEPTFIAGDAVSNTLVITETATTVTFQDANDAITATEDVACALNSPAAGDVTCTRVVLPNVTPLIGADLSTGDLASNTNTLTSATTTSLTATGGAGVDTLNGGAGPDTLNGGGGNDTLNGGADGDTLNGGAGNDTLNGGAGNDVMDGEAGDDAVNGDAGTDSITLNAGNDDIHGGDSDPITFADGNPVTTGDIVDASASADPLNITFDNAANDGIAGQTANIHSDVETLLSGTGADTINLRNGVTNLVTCGPGTDTANLDAADAVVGSDCETITFNNPAVVAPPVTTPPAAAPAIATAPAIAPTPTPTPTPNTASNLAAAKSVSAKATPTRDRSKPYKFAIRGTVVMPTGVTTAKGCKGTVTITAKRGTKTVGTTKVTLKKDCTYSATVTVKGKGKLKLTAEFGGNTAVGTKTSATLNLRAG